VERARGQEEAARASLDTARAQQRLYTAAATLPDAEAVLFEAEHGNPRRAVELGRQVWEEAPSTRSADALGWAYVRAGDPATGVEWARRALSTGSRDALYRLHAAVAFDRIGRDDAAQRNFDYARRGRAALPPSAAAFLEEGPR
jgi:Flp pilus assembly protein TadD